MDRQKEHIFNKILKGHEFLLESRNFKGLGVKCFTSTDEISTINYEGQLQEINQVLSIWKKRQLTPLWKITVIKTLVISKITHLFTTLPDPSAAFLREFENVLFQFLWNGKRSKIKTTVVCKPYEEGGFRMLDVYSFLTTMKLRWLRRINVNDSILKTFVLSMYPELCTPSRFESEYVKNVIHGLQNPFWKYVLGI